MSSVSIKPIVFLAFANDRDDSVNYLRNLPDEARRLRDVLRAAEQAGLCTLEVRSNCTVADIFKVFQDARFRNRIAIFHYGGHANGYQLLLESADGPTATAHAEGIAAFLGQQQGLQLVFLNGCSTQQQTQGLLNANISAVISTSRSIDDKVATDFACHFYQGLAGGATIRTAFEEAAAIVRTSNGGGDTRALYFGPASVRQHHLEADRWPWNLYFRDGSNHLGRWNLPEAVNDPLFGLPPLSESALPDSPYRNLNWFTRKHAEIFFGRGHQIRELYERLTAPHAAPIVMFYGQSGVGKSSILEAGLLPRLERDYEVRYLRRTENGLLDTLRLAFLPEASSASVENAWREKEESLNKPLIVILDQIEELFTRPICDLPNELNDLLKTIQATFVTANQRPQGKLVLAFRKEWLADLEAQMAKYELPRSKVFLERLDRRGIIEVVLGPTRSDRMRHHFGLTIEDGLAEVLADDLLADKGSAVSTTLQILLSKMWMKAAEANYEEPRFSLDLYHDLQREGILLSDFLDQQLKAFHTQLPELADSGLLLDVLEQHTTAIGTSTQCSRDALLAQYRHVSHVLPRLLQKSQDLYLLSEAVSTQKEDIKATRLAHDTLGPLIRKSVEESDKPGQRARRILESRIQEWSILRSYCVESDHRFNDSFSLAPRSILLNETDLGLVESGETGTRTWTNPERQLIEASRNWKRRRVRNRRIASFAILTGLALIVAAVGVGWYFQVDRNFQAQERKFENEKRVLAEKNEATAKSLAKLQTAWAMTDEGLRRGEAGDTVAAAHLYARAADVLVEMPENQLEDRLRLGHFSQMYPELVRVIEHPSPIGSISLSPDGKLLVSSYKEINTDPSSIRLGNSPYNMASVALVWNVKEGNLVHVLDEHNGPVYSADFTHDGQSVRTSSLNSFEQSFTKEKTTTALWGTATGNLAIPDDGLRNPPDTMVPLTTSPDSRWMICVDEGILRGNIRLSNDAFLWDLSSGKVVHRLEGHEDLIVGAAFDPGSKLVATASKDKTVRVWRIENGQLQDVLEGHIDRVNSVQFSRDGNRILTTSDDKSARVWRVRAPQTGPMRWTPEPSLIAECHRPQFTLSSAATKVEGTAGLGISTVTSFRESGLENAVISSDGRFVLTAGDSWDDRNARLWSAESGQLIATLEGHGGAVTAVAISPDGTLLFTGSDDQTVRIWKWNSKVSEGTELTGHKGRVEDVFYSANGRRIITVGEVGQDGSVRMRDSETGELLTAIGTSSISAARFTNSDKLLVTTCCDNSPDYKGIRRIRMWDGMSGLLKRTLDFGEGRATLLALSRDGTLAAYCEDGRRLSPINKAIYLCNLASGEEVQLAQPDSVLEILFVPQVPFLAARTTNSVLIWNVETKQVIHKFGPVFGSIDISPDGKLLAAPSSENAAVIWSLETGEAIATLKGHSDSVQRISFAPAGNILISSANDKTLRVWDLNSRRTIQILRGHKEPPEGFAISRNGQVVLSFAGSSYTGVSKDNSVRLWSIRTGKLILKRGFDEPVLAVAIHPEATSFVVSTGRQFGGTVRLFRLPVVDLPASKIASWIEERTGAKLDDAGGLQSLTPNELYKNSVKGNDWRAIGGFEKVPWFEVFDRLMERKDFAGAAWSIGRASMMIEASERTMSEPVRGGSITKLLNGADLLAGCGRSREATEVYSRVASIMKVPLANRDTQSETPAFEYHRIWQCSTTLWSKVVSADSSNVDARLHRSLAATKLGHILSDDNKLADAIELYSLALADRQALCERFPQTALYEYHLCGGLSNLANGFRAAGQNEKAAKLLGQALALAKSLVAKEPQSAEYQSRLDSINEDLAAMKDRMKSNE